MSRLIDGDALEREGWLLHRTFQKDRDTIVYEVKKPSDFPAIEERKKGTWLVHLYELGKERYECDQCQGRCDMGYRYCPNCGADMREGRR